MKTKTVFIILSFVSFRLLGADESLNSQRQANLSFCKGRLALVSIGAATVTMAVMSELKGRATADALNEMQKSAFSKSHQVRFIEPNTQLQLLYTSYIRSREQVLGRSWKPEDVALLETFLKFSTEVTNLSNRDQRHEDAHQFTTLKTLREVDGPEIERVKLFLLQQSANDLMRSRITILSDINELEQGLKTTQLTEVNRARVEATIQRLKAKLAAIDLRLSGMSPRP